MTSIILLQHSEQPEGPEPKRSRKSISLADKFTIVKRLTNGDSITQLAREYKMSESTIRNIRKQEATIRETAMVMTHDGANGSLRHRNLRMSKMEGCLVTWLKDMRGKRLADWYGKVRAKALELYEEIGTLGYEDEVGFSASKGWFDRFKKKYKLSEILPCDVRVPPSEASFKEVLSDIVEKGKFTRDQIFMAEKTTFWWKRFPGLLEEDHASLVVCANASGNLVMQPVLFSSRASLNPEVVALPPEQAEFLSPDDFLGWFKNFFVPQLQSGQKVLLILAHDLTYPREINHPSVDVIRLPPDCNSSLLPAAQGFLEHLNAVYLKQVACKLVYDVSSDKTLGKAWAQFTIDDAHLLLTNSIGQLNTSAVVNSWANLLNDVPGNFCNESILKDITLVAHSLGLVDINNDHVQKLITPRELTNEEVIELYQKRQVAVNDLPTEADRTSPEALDHGVRLALVEEIDRHVAALVDAKQFFEQHDRAKARVEAISKRLYQVCRWAAELRKELEPDIELQPIDVIEVKNEPLALDSEDE